jgi:predicted nucleic-acid-binding Zn-ribbon protein
MEIGHTWIAFECPKCSYKWINWINGKEGSKHKRCAKCKRWDWEEGYLSLPEKNLRRDLLEIEENEINHPTVQGTDFYSIPTDICATFLSIYPRPTEKELRIVLNPICYLGPFDHSRHPFSHKGTCIDQVYCGPGWIPRRDKPGDYELVKKINEEMERRERCTS